MITRKLQSTYKKIHNIISILFLKKKEITNTIIVEDTLTI